jgi:hypothetical protein
MALCKSFRCHSYALRVAQVLCLPLIRKHPGWGCHAPSNFRSFAWKFDFDRPLFSKTYKSLFPQPLFFHIHTPGDVTFSPCLTPSEALNYRAHLLPAFVLRDPGSFGGAK